MDFEMMSAHDVHEQSVHENKEVDPSAPSCLRELLSEVQALCERDGSLHGAQALLQVVRKHHFWPALQVKKFFTEKNLVLLHNTYKRVDVSHFKNLYDECRSVVLDMAAPAGQNVIVSFADHIPERLVGAQYEALMSPADRCAECFEGTVVTVYHYQSKWYFGTSSCPTVNSSRFHHPTLTHGDMLNDALLRMLGGEEGNAYDDACMMGGEETTNKDAIRDRFTKLLDPAKAYAFVLVHHHNRHVIDYTERLGPEYAKLVHLGTRDRNTLVPEDISHQPFGPMGILYATKFQTPAEAMEVLKASPSMYGVFVVAEDGQRYKVSRDDIVHREECDLGSPNPWINMLWVFMQNRPNYHVQDYQKEFAPHLQLPTDSKGRPMSPTYIIYTVMCNMRDVLHQLYRSTTNYYPTYRRFKMNRDLDQQYCPVIRFHLAQLRHVQVQHHHHAYLSKTAVYHYLCFHQTLKNVRTLIEFFAENSQFFPPRHAECFRVLHAMLSYKQG